MNAKTLVAVVAAAFAVAARAQEIEAESAPSGQQAAVQSQTDAEPEAETDAPSDTTEAPVATKKEVTDIIRTDGYANAKRSGVKTPVVKGTYTDGKVSHVDIDCDNAPLGAIVRQFRKATSANIICLEDSTNLNKRISVTLNRVPWLEGLKAILGSNGFRLDERDGIYRVVEDKQIIPITTRTYTLNHASAKELAALFNSTYSVKNPQGQIIKPIATSFDGANVVVISAEEKILADCETIIKAVDKAIAQIYIEARFIELSSEAMHKLGMQWNSLESWGASVRNLSGGMEYNNGRGANYGLILDSHNTSVSESSGENATKTLSENLTYKGFTPSSIAGAPGAGRSAESMAWRTARGFQGQLSVDDFRLAMSAFEQIGDAKVFSNPKIIVSNGKEARVDMTTKFPNVRVQATRNTSNGSDSLDISTQLEAIPGEDKLMFAKEVFFGWGITLSVKPRISPDGLINVEIIPTISQLDTDVTPTGFYQVKGGDSSAYSSYPIIQVKRLTTDFTMKDGATAVIGGLSKTTEEDIDSGIPYLRKIPWIGPKLFGWKSRGKVQKEIIVCVTLGMADPADLPADVGLPKNAVVGREYIAGRKFEPGDRAGGLADVMSLDMRAIEEKQADNTRGPGTVTITPVVEPGK